MWIEFKGKVSSPGKITWAALEELTNILITINFGHYCMDLFTQNRKRKLYFKIFSTLNKWIGKYLQTFFLIFCNGILNNKLFFEVIPSAKCIFLLSFFGKGEKNSNNIELFLKQMNCCHILIEVCTGRIFQTGPGPHGHNLGPARSKEKNFGEIEI